MSCSPSVAGTEGRCLSPKRETDAKPGTSPTGGIVPAVPASTAKAEGSPSWKTSGVKAGFAVEAGGCGGSLAEDGTGVAGDEGEEEAETGGENVFGLPKMGRSD
jgi:hypothetical protein